MRRGGNPNWGSPNVPVVLRPTEFEQQVEKLSLGQAEYRTSPQLKDWCRRNARVRYVPEYLLVLWGIHVNDSLSQPIAEYTVATRGR